VVQYTARKTRWREPARLPLCDGLRGYHFLFDVDPG
jgi:hypothetical protein